MSEISGPSLEFSCCIRPVSLLEKTIFYIFDCSAAEAFFKQAIEIKENALGNEHPSLVKVRCGNQTDSSMPLALHVSV